MSAALLLAMCFVSLTAGLACGWLGVLGGNNARLRQLQRDVGMAFDDIDALDGRLRRREGAAGQAARKAREPTAPGDGPASTEEVAVAQGVLKQVAHRLGRIVRVPGGDPPSAEVFDPGPDRLVLDKQGHRG